MPPRRLTERQLAILKRRVYSANYRSAREYASRDQIHLDEVLELLLSDPHCYYCGRELTAGTLSLDHRIPLSAAGTNRIENIVLSCRRDNRYKSAIPATLYKAFLTHLGEEWRTFFFSHYRPHAYRHR